MITMHPFSTDVWTVTFPTDELAGLYNLTVFADSDDVIIETNEYNNKLIRSVYINAEPDINYIDAPLVQGYNENVDIDSRIVDPDNNIETANLTLNATKHLLQNVSDDYYADYNSTVPGRYPVRMYFFIW